MTTLTVTIPEDRLLQLQEIAARFRLTPEELVRISIEEILSRPQEEVQQAVNYVLQKNAELYRRLA
jgi:hypothetical protein